MSIARRVALVLVGIVAVAIPPASAAQKTKSSKKSAVKSVLSRSATNLTPSIPTRTRKPLYSAERSMARKTVVARARATSSAREIAEAIVPRYKVDAAGDLVPDLRAAAAIVYDPDTQQVLWEEHSQDQRSIASITKVMTALVFLESDPDLSEMITVTRPDVSHASTTHLRSNDRLEAGDLLHLLLISSDNAAARVLARVSPYGSTGFIQRMNEKAAELGLQSTRYADPSGLLSDNVSSAYDMARLIAYVSVNDRIGSIMRTQEYTAYTARRPIAIHSTNHLLGRDDVEVRGGKTGFINSSGYCLATLLRLPESGQQVAVVVLGARSNAGRFLETQNLFNWFMSKAPAIFSTRTTLAAQEQ